MSLSTSLPFSQQLMSAFNTIQEKVSWYEEEIIKLQEENKKYTSQIKYLIDDKKELQEFNQSLIDDKKELTDKLQIRKATRVKELEDTILELQEQVQHQSNVIKEKCMENAKLRNSVEKMDKVCKNEIPNWESIVQDGTQHIHKRREICKYWEQGRCRCSATECSFAHGQKMIGTKYMYEKGKLINCPPCK